MKRLRITVGAFVAILLLAAAGSLAFLYLRSQSVNEVAAFQTELRNGLVKSCERNGNPLREAVQGMLKEQIEQSKSPAIRKFFPQIPDGEFGRLVALANARRRARIAELTPLDCAALYPK